MDFEKQLVLGKHFIIGTVEVNRYYKYNKFFYVNLLLTLSAKKIPPYIIIKRDHNGTFKVDGFVHQIVHFLAEKFSFT